MRELTSVEIRFMVEPGILEIQAQVLVPSLVAHVAGAYSVRAFCRADRILGLSDVTRSLLSQHSIPIMDMTNPFPDGYGAGNKCVLATLPCESSHICILDTDVCLLQRADFNEIALPDAVSVVPESRNAWSMRPADWAAAYDFAGVPYDGSTIDLLNGDQSMPFFNAGMVLFPRGTFGTNWLSLAEKMYGAQLPNRAERFFNRTKRFTDQITLPMAIQITEGVETHVVPAMWNNSADLEMHFEDRILCHYHRFRKIVRVGMQDRFERNLKAIGATYSTIDQLRDLSDDLGVSFADKALA